MSLCNPKRDLSALDDIKDDFEVSINAARVFILVAYVLTGPTFVTACGHSAERLQTNDSTQRTNSAQDMTADKDLIEAVEAFASQGGEAGERAWKRIELRPRQELIQSLESQRHDEGQRAPTDPDRLCSLRPGPGLRQKSDAGYVFDD